MFYSMSSYVVLFLEYFPHILQYKHYLEKDFFYIVLWSSLT